MSNGSKTQEPVTELSLVLGYWSGRVKHPVAGDGGDNLVKRVSPEFVWAVSKMKCHIICDPKQL